MRANLQELAKVMRPMSDDAARQLVRRFEEETGPNCAEFVAAEREGSSEYWDASHGIQAAQQPRRVRYG